MADTAGPLIRLKFGMQGPEHVFGLAWGLGWMLPPGGWGIDRFLVHDFRWEHLAASALTPTGQGGLARYTPTVPLPTLEQMIEQLLGAGFGRCNIADGGESHLGAWSMDCVCHAFRQWHGVSRRKARMSVLGNHIYMLAATKMAGDCRVGLAHWTRLHRGGVQARPGGQHRQNVRDSLHQG